jgi:hypothetical protein
MHLWVQQSATIGIEILTIQTLYFNSFGVFLYNAPSLRHMSWNYPDAERMIWMRSRYSELYSLHSNWYPGLLGLVATMQVCKADRFKRVKK